MTNSGSVYLVEETDTVRGRRGVVEIYERRIEALVYAHNRARERINAEGGELYFGETEYPHPVRDLGDPPTLHPCEFVSAKDAIWYIHRYPL